jgi:hypothetical protein
VHNHDLHLQGKGEAPRKVRQGDDAPPAGHEEPVVVAVEPDHPEEPHEMAVNDDGQRMAVAIVLTEEASTVRDFVSFRLPCALTHAHTHTHTHKHTTHNTHTHTTVLLSLFLNHV